AWYAPDLVEAILRARPLHEVGSHSFAHPCYTDLSAAAAARDLEEAASTHREHGLPFESFVFPRNRVAHTALLASAGWRVCRTVARGCHRGAARLAATPGRAANLADKAIPVPSPTVLPRRGADLLEVESSLLLIGRDGLRRLVRPAVLVAKAA